MSLATSAVDFTPEELEKAVSQFYQADAAVQAKAHQWLTAAQTTPEAWTFVWELLQPNKSTELQFFAATTLHTKVVKWWKEVPEDQYPVLKKKLIEAIVNHCLGPKIVLNKLCITLSAYLLQTIPVHWPNAITELLTTLQPSYLPSLPPERTAWILLEILTVLPEEFQSSHLSQHQKGVVRNELQRNVPQVLSLLEEILATNSCVSASEGSLEVIHQVLRCSGSWLQMGIPLPDCMRLADLLTSTLVSSINLPQHHHIGNIPEAALDALQAMATHPDTHKYPASCLQLLGKLLPLHTVIHQVRSEDQELQSNLYCMLISVAESHSRLLVNSLVTEGPAKDGSLQLIHIILQCSNSPGVYPVQETLSQHALGFWYILQDDMLGTEPEQSDTIMQTLGPVYLMLAEIILHKSVLPNDEASWTCEEREQLRCYRQDVADTMMYCYNVLHVKLLELLLRKLEGALEEVNASVKGSGGASVGGSPSGWQMLESVLHAFVAVAECLDTNDEGHVPRFINTLERLPFAHLNLRVINTALNVIGSCAEWINQHPQSMGHVVPLLVTGLKSPEVAPAATMALKDLTRECLGTIGSFSHPILQATQEALTSGQLQSGECVRLMFTVGRLLSVLPLERTMQYLEVMIVPYVNELQSLSEQELNPSVKGAVVLRLKMLSMLFGSLVVPPPLAEGDLPDSQPSTGAQSPVQPVFFILQRVMPLTQNIVYRMGRDDDILQALFSMFKSAVSTLLEGSEPFLSELLTLLISSYREFPHPAALDLALQVLTLYGRDEKHQSYMHSLLKMVCNYTMQHFFCGANLSEHVDVLDSFFKLLAQVLRKHASLFSVFEPNDCSALFQAGTVTLAVPEIQAVKAASQFLCNFITQSREIPHLLGVVQLCGEALVHQVLRCIGGESSRTALEPLSEIFLALNKKYCDNLPRWLHQTMQPDGFPSPRVSAADKDHFVKLVLKERANKRKLQDVVREFSFVCRGIIGMYPTQPQPF